MNIDLGLAVVIAAVLIFYLRLIVLQRERARQISRNTETSPKRRARGKDLQTAPPPRYSILSQNPRDLAIGGVGVFLILIGVLLYARILPLPVAQAYWWIPTSIGIVAFSWVFKI